MDNTEQPTLPKWPFYIGDVLLLSTALVIVLRAEKPIGTPIIAWCVMLVALGACILTFPYVMEYLNGLRSTNNQLNESVDALVGGLRGTLDEVNRHERVLADLAQKSANAVSKMDASIGEMDERISGVESSFEVVLNERNALFDSALKEKLGEQCKPLEALLKRFQRLQENLLEEIGKLEAQGVRMEGISDSLSERVEFFSGSESIVLNADAVRSGSVERASEESGSVVADPVENDGEAEEETGADMEDAYPADGVVEIALLEPAVESTSTAEKKPKIAKKKKRAPRKKAEAKSDPEPVEETEKEEPLLFEDNEVGDAIIRTRSEDPESLTLVVNAHVGIGNKPYVKGEGAGLSWDKGIPMDFVEIGKWEWTAEEGSGGAVARVYLNDSLSALGEEISLEAGERVECTARFPESPTP